MVQFLLCLLLSSVSKLFVLLSKEESVYQLQICLISALPTSQLFQFILFVYQEAQLHHEKSNAFQIHIS